MTYRPKPAYERSEEPTTAAYAVCSVIAGALLIAAISYVAAQIEGPAKTG